MLEQQALANLAQLAHAFVDAQIAVLQQALPTPETGHIPIPEEPTTDNKTPMPGFPSEC